MLIAELLNPNGSHQQSTVFLKLFLTQFGIQAFDPDSAQAIVEYHIGTKTASTGGSIDIVVKDALERRVLIENKIYAADQENQLLRYFNYDKRARLFYLTLDGVASGKQSTGHILNKDHYTCISYKSDLLEWLEACKKEAVNLPILRETLTQYIYLIKYLTNQTTNQVMQQEITQFVLKDKESLEAFFTVSDT